MRAAHGLYHHEKRASELVKGHLGLLGVSRGLALPVKGEPGHDNDQPTSFAKWGPLFLVSHNGPQRGCELSTCLMGL